MYYVTMIIYKATNLINGKIYIGQTIVSLTERKGDHKRKSFKHNSKSSFHSAIRKYGFDNFKWEIIDTAETRKELNDKEKKWIKHYESTNNKKGYNLTSGGDCIEFTEEVKKKISLAQIGKKITEDQSRERSKRMAGKGNHFYGKKHTEESKNKISKSRKGIKGKYTEESKLRTIKKGSDNGMAKINELTALNIKIDLKNGLKIKAISIKYNISESIVKSIKYGHTWKQIKI